MSVNETQLRLIHEMYSELPPYNIEAGKIFVAMAKVLEREDIVDKAEKMIELEVILNDHQTMTLAVIDTYFANPNHPDADHEIHMLSVTGVIADVLLKDHKALQLELDALLADVINS